MEHKLSLMGGGGAPTVDPLPKALITLRNAQVRRISWVRGVRPVRERHEWPPHDAAPGRPPFLIALRRGKMGARRITPARPPWSRAFPSALQAGHLNLASQNSTCFLATGSYFFLL